MTLAPMPLLDTQDVRATPADVEAARRITWVLHFLAFSDLDEIARVYGCANTLVSGEPTGYLVAKFETVKRDPARFWVELDQQNRERLCRLSREKYQPEVECLERID